MSDDLQIAVVNDPQTVAVPQPDIAVVVADVSEPVVITSPEIQVVAIEDDVHVVDEVRDIQIVTVGEAGPAGRDGYLSLPDGSVTGDFLRYNTVTGGWEVASEPVELKGLVLTPALASLVDAEGAVYYNSSSKNVQVCTDV